MNRTREPAAGFALAVIFSADTFRRSGGLELNMLNKCFTAQITSVLDLCTFLLLFFGLDGFKDNQMVFSSNHFLPVKFSFPGYLLNRHVRLLFLDFCR